MALLPARGVGGGGGAQTATLALMSQLALGLPAGQGPEGAAALPPSLALPCRQRTQLQRMLCALALPMSSPPLTWGCSAPGGCAPHPHERLWRKCMGGGQQLQQLLPVPPVLQLPWQLRRGRGHGHGLLQRQLLLQWPGTPTTSTQCCPEREQQPAAAAGAAPVAMTGLAVAPVALACRAPLTLPPQCPPCSEAEAEVALVQALAALGLAGRLWTWRCWVGVVVEGMRRPSHCLGAQSPLCLPTRSTGQQPGRAAMSTPPPAAAAPVAPVRAVFLTCPAPLCWCCQQQQQQCSRG